MTTNLNERAKMRDDILALANSVNSEKIFELRQLRAALMPVRAYRDHLLTEFELTALKDVEFSSSAHLAAAKLTAVAASMLATDTLLKEDGFVMEESIDSATIHGESLAASKVYYPHLLAEVEELQRYDIEEMSGDPWRSYRCIGEDDDGDYVRLEDVLRVLGGGNA